MQIDVQHEELQLTAEWSLIRSDKPYTTPQSTINSQPPIVVTNQAIYLNSQVILDADRLNVLNFEKTHLRTTSQALFLLI